MHCAAGADFCTCGVIAMVTGDGEIISEHVLVPDAIIFLPVAASVFINTAETDFRAKIFKIFARQFAGLQPVQRLESIKIHIVWSWATP